jgi:ribonuclease P protein component
MNKRYRIKKQREIDAIFKIRKSKGNAYFSVYRTTDKTQTVFRFAVTIGRKYGNAVERNLAKRRIRMILQGFKGLIATDASFVIVIKPAARTLTYQEMESNMGILLKKSNILTETET